MDVKEAAQILSISGRNVRMLIERGKIKAEIVKEGNKRKYIIDEESFNEYLKTRKVRKGKRRGRLKKMEDIKIEKVEKIEERPKRRALTLLDYIEALIVEGISRIFRV